MSEPSTDTAILTKKHDMRFETTIVFVKALCHLVIGVFTPWAASLAQWVNSGEWPSKIVWIGVILPASAVGGASALQAFLSGSYRTYTDKKAQSTKP